MNVVAKAVFKGLFRFFSVKRNRCLFFVILICLAALVEFLALGLIRRTFVFYSALDNSTIVEDRMFHRSDSLETDIRRYVEEVLLGPESQNAASLVPRGTRLLSLFYRENTVYADFSDNSALPETVTPGSSVFTGFLTLNEGIRRNFAKVKNVKLFIGGNEIFFNEFYLIFADPADNTIKPGQRALTN
jgi:spore germination protein GerM